MKRPTRLSGYALAAAAAGLFATLSLGTAVADDEEEGGSEEAAMKCENSTTCKGHGACQGANNLCRGQNACRGKGFTFTESAEDCKKAQQAAKKAKVRG